MRLLQKPHFVHQKVKKTIPQNTKKIITNVIIVKKIIANVIIAKKIIANVIITKKVNLQKTKKSILQKKNM
ncbi:hypothetical protein DOZ91_09500 [Peribacillus frigoritolerans]|nr:hypothetical protein DOZ91_09500 [Peribacillus frigoritolerans]